MPEQFETKNEDPGIVEGIGDFLHGAAYGFLQSPIDGITQIAGKITGQELQALQLIPVIKEHNNWNNAGLVAGSVGEFVVVAKVQRLGLAGSGLVKSGAPLSVMEMASAGALAETLHPLNPQIENFRDEKIRRAAVSFGTFTVMGGANYWCHDAGMLGRAGRRTLAESVSVNTFAGFAGGFAHAQLDAMSHGKPFATANEYAEQMGRFAAFGALFGVAEAGLFRVQYSLSSGKGTESGARKGPTSEEYITQHYDGKQPLQSEILSWLADTRADLRPPNYASWKLETQPMPNNGRHLDLLDWRPEQRLLVLQELRKLSNSKLSTDANIDAFISRIEGRGEVEAFRSRSSSPEQAKALDGWAEASAKLTQLVESDVTLWERQLSQIIKDKNLHAERPDVKHLVDEIARAEQSYRALAASARLSSKVGSALQDELNAIAGEMGLPKLKKGLEIEVNDDGGAYFANRLSIGDRAVIAGPGRLVETAIHEIRHHEKGRNIDRELFADAVPSISPTTRQYRASVELSLLERQNGTLDFLSRVGNPENVSYRIFHDTGSLPLNLTEYAGAVRKGEFSTALWDEAVVNKSVRDFLTNQIKDAGAQIRADHTRYLGTAYEVPAWSLGFLGRVRIQALGLHDGLVADLPPLVNVRQFTWDSFKK